MQESAHSACSSDHQRWRLWRERAAPSSWVCTSQRTSPGPTTLRHWPRKHNSVSTSSANSEEPVPRPPSCAPSTEATIESILTSCITVWYGACNASCRKSLQWIVRAAEKIVGVSLSPPSRTSTSTRLTPQSPLHCRWSHPPAHNFFSLLPSGRRLRSLRPGPTDWRTASSIRLSGSWTPSRPCPPSPLLPPESLNSDTTTPPPSSPHPQDLPPSSPPGPPPPPLQTWPAPVTLCSTGLISTSSSIVCKLPLLTVW